MNRLADQQSPYLLQHAHNPVDWYPWSPQALDKAKQEQKPILLSIGYSTCHWCHVMAHESFEDADISQVMNGLFVCIKVDREERPDLDHIYMTAVTAMTGQGGWPLTVFLTPDAKPFYGGTYFPPYPKWGAPGFKDLLLSVGQAWQNSRQEILNSSEEIAHLINQKSAAPMPSSAVTTALFDSAFRQMSAQFDPAYGGFGRAPKFPMPHNLSFLLTYHARSAKAESWRMVEKTLDEMAAGGIYDHLGGGFHRYATDQQWRLPHFEKMLYDQALLIYAYTQAYQASGKSAYAKVIEETAGYCLADLASPEGGFYCAEDADTEGREGAFYVWTQKEIEEVLGTEVAALFNRYYGVEAHGNAVADPHNEFAGQNILFLTKPIEVQDKPALEQARRKLLERRSRRPRPHLDDKVLTDWNGLMIGALALAGAVLGRNEYVEAAGKAADFILRELVVDGKLLHRWRKGGAGIEGMLEDYAFFVFGLLQLYEATFNERYLAASINLSMRMAELFEDNSAGGFFMTQEGQDLIARPQDIYDGALPSGNSVAGFVLMKLYVLTSEEHYRRSAEKLFQRFAGTVSQAPQAYAFFMCGLDLYLNPPFEVTVRAPQAADSSIANIRKVVYKHFVPGLVVKYASGPQPWAANVCREGVCLPVVNDLAALDKLMGEKRL